MIVQQCAERIKARAPLSEHGCAAPLYASAVPRKKTMQAVGPQCPAKAVLAGTFAKDRD